MEMQERAVSIETPELTNMPQPTKTSNQPELISAQQLIKRWRCSITSVYNRANKLNIRSIKVGKVRSYYLDDIKEAESIKPVRAYNRKSKSNTPKGHRTPKRTKLESGGGPGYLPSNLPYVSQVCGGDYSTQTNIGFISRLISKLKRFFS
jgi:hypothetical protein